MEKKLRMIDFHDDFIVPNFLNCMTKISNNLWIPIGQYDIVKSTFLGIC